jgi:hypothetical protein
MGTAIDIRQLRSQAPDVRVGQKVRIPYGYPHGGRYGDVQSVHGRQAAVSLGGYDHEGLATVVVLVSELVGQGQ